MDQSKCFHLIHFAICNLQFAICNLHGFSPRPASHAPRAPARHGMRRVNPGAGRAGGYQRAARVLASRFCPPPRKGEPHSSPGQRPGSCERTIREPTPRSPDTAKRSVHRINAHPKKRTVLCQARQNLPNFLPLVRQGFAAKLALNRHEIRVKI